MTDSDILRCAALILKSRSTRPNGLWMRVFCRVLYDTAEKMEVTA